MVIDLGVYTSWRMTAHPHRVSSTRYVFESIHSQAGSFWLMQYVTGPVDSLWPWPNFLFCRVIPMEFPGIMFTESFVNG